VFRRSCCEPCLRSNKLLFQPQKKWEMRGKTFPARTRKCEWADKEGGGGKKELCSWESTLKTPMCGMKKENLKMGKRTLLHKWVLRGGGENKEEFYSWTEHGNVSTSNADQPRSLFYEPLKEFKLWRYPKVNFKLAVCIFIISKNIPRLNVVINI